MEPTAYQLLAAVRVARILDEGGNTSEDAHRAFPLVISQGEHRAGDLLGGESILAILGIIHTESDGRISPTSRLAVLVSLPDADAVQYLSHMFAQRSQELVRAEVGVAGEVAVVEACRSDLMSLGRADLALAVQQVSVLDDSLGYDVVAPMITGPMRLLEVKTATNPGPIFQFFLTRNEYEVGRRESGLWSLIACSYRPGADGASLLGWCRAVALQPYLPNDANGRWTEALVRLPLSALFSGIPRAV